MTLPAPVVENGGGRGVAQIDRVEPVAWIAVRFEAPDRGDPQAGGVAIAVHEDDRQWLLGGVRTAEQRGKKHEGGEAHVVQMLDHLFPSHDQAHASCTAVTTRATAASPSCG
jgi:hypothetical protein